MRSLVAGRRRVATVSFDQALYAVGNFAVSAGVSRTAGVEALGVFTLQYLSISIAIGAWRAGRLDRLLVGVQRPPRLLGQALAVGLVAGATGALVSVASTGGYFRLMLLAGPAVLLTDSVRYLMLRARPDAALRIDLAWTAVTVCAAFAAGAPSLVILAWAAGGAIPAVTMLLLDRYVRRDAADYGPVEVPDSIDGGTARWWAADQVVAAVAGLAAGTLMTAVLGPADFGIIRLAQLVFSPLGVIFTALPALLLPRWSALGWTASVRRDIRLVSVTLAAGVALLTLVIVSGVFTPVLRGLFGPDWDELPWTVLLAVGAGRVGATVSAVAVVGWRVVDQGSALFVRRAVPSVASLAATAVVIVTTEDLLLSVITMAAGQLLVALLAATPVMRRER